MAEGFSKGEQEPHAVNVICAKHNIVSLANTIYHKAAKIPEQMPELCSVLDDPKLTVDFISKMLKSVILKK